MLYEGAREDRPLASKASSAVTITLDGESKGDSERWEYVMVFSIQKRQNMEQIKLLLQEGTALIIKEQDSRDGDEIFLYLSATDKTFEEKAEEYKLKKKLLEIHGGGYAHYEHKHKSKFEDSDNMHNFFTSYERSRMVYTMIVGRKKEGGAHIDVNRHIAAGSMLACFCLHEENAREALRQTWVKGWTKPQPIDSIREYFGEYIAIYFAWLGHYTTWLAVPAAIGFILLLVGFGVGFDNVGSIIYSFFITLWATVYLEFWKRRNAELACEWDVDDFVEQEVVRSSFVGEKKTGFYYDSEFVSLDADRDFKPPSALWAPTEARYFKFGVGLSFLCTFLGIVVIATFGIFMFRLFMIKATGSFGSIVAGCLNATVIILLNRVYRIVAIKLTDWENYRTESEYENSFIVKNFLFQFVNSYISLFYIAFIKGHINLFNFKEDVCKPDCMTELTFQLGSIFITNIVVGQANEIGIPWAQGKFSLYMENRKMAKQNMANVDATPAEMQSKLYQYPNAFDDYNEMAIQFGYITLFAAAFPGAPLAALINNLVEIRTDAVKLLDTMQRPHPRGARDIGRWFQILEIISFCSVVTNAALIVFTSKMLEKLDKDNKITGFEKLWVALLIEHAVFLFKWICAKVIPDVPYWVRQKNARKTFFRELAFEGERVIQENDISEYLKVNPQVTSEKSSLLH